MKLQILVPTLPERKESFDKLCAEIYRQRSELGLTNEVGICFDDAPRGVTIGTKRNFLLKNAIADYVAYVDDDDFIGENYLSRLFEGINKNVDCCSLRGVITWNGENPEIFEHSLKYSEWKTTDNEIKYERGITPLNCIKRTIAQQFSFPENNFGEDQVWSDQLMKSNLLKTEYYIDEVIYHYKFIPNK